MRRALLGLVLVATAGCLDRTGVRRSAERFATGNAPDSAPVMLNEESPFRYPPSLWAQRVQGNVVLRLFVDSTGHAREDSTRIAESSGMQAFDSAAVTGVPNLRFRPARMHGAPVGVALLLPVFFRHPDAPPLPGDSVLKLKKAGLRDR